MCSSVMLILCRHEPLDHTPGRAMPGISAWPGDTATTSDKVCLHCQHMGSRALCHLPSLGASSTLVSAWIGCYYQGMRMGFGLLLQPCSGPCVSLDDGQAACKYAASRQRPFPVGRSRRHQRSAVGNVPLVYRRRTLLRPWTRMPSFLARGHRRLGCLPALTTEDRERPAHSLQSCRDVFT